MPEPTPSTESLTDAARDTFHKILAGPEPAHFDDLLRGLERVSAGLPSRVNAEPQNVERGLAKLVLTLVELLRQLMERQAIRRMEQKTLTKNPNGTRRWIEFGYAGRFANYVFWAEGLGCLSRIRTRQIVGRCRSGDRNRCAPAAPAIGHFRGEIG